MQIHLIENSWIANHLFNYNVTLYPFILLKKSVLYSKLDHSLNHEWVHVLQVQKLGWFNFYWQYLKELVSNYFKYGHDWSQAYSHISFEIEAYAKMATQLLPEDI